VQYHPEAAAGPHDSMYLFDRFRDMVIARRDGVPFDAATSDATTPAADPQIGTNA
jgi:carbamoyl-phosphate synthase small subunit